MGTAAGILILLISIAHSVYGEKKQIPDLRNKTDDAITIGSARIMIHQGGVILLFAGLLQLLSSLDVWILEGVARYIPITLVSLNVVVSFGIALGLHREIFKITIPQFVLFALIIVLQVLSLG
jgi:hypothetical protein